MRIIIDTEKERIIVPDSFFNQIDKMNEVLKTHGGKNEKGEPQQIDYVQYIKDAYEKAIKNAPIRKSDIKRWWLAKEQE